MRQFTILLICSFSIICSAQDVEWIRTSLSLAAVEGTDLCVDNEDNIYVVGLHTDETQFDEILIGESFSTMFVSKYAPDGAIQWAKTIKGNSNNQIRSIVFDGNEHIYITGYYYQTNDLTILDFGDTQIEGREEPGLFLAKLDLEGNTEWVSTILTLDELGQQFTEPDDMIFTSEGKILIAGGIETSLVTIDNANIPIEHDQEVFFFSSFNDDGSLDWFNYGKSRIDNIRIQEYNGHLIFSGNLKSTMLDYDGFTTEVNQIDADAIFMKLDLDGNVIWQTGAGHLSFSADIGGLDINSQGDLKFVLPISNWINYDGTQYDPLGPNLEIFSVDNDGNLDSRSEMFSGIADFVTGAVYVDHLKVGSDDNMFVVGRMESPSIGFYPVFFGDTIGGFGFMESYLAAYSENGNYAGVVPFSFPEGDMMFGQFWVNDIIANNAGELILTGYFISSLTIGDITIATTDNVREFFLIKLDPLLNFDFSVDVKEQAEINFKIYPNPVRDYLILENPDGYKSYRISTITGQFIQSGNLIAGLNRIGLEKFQNGTYFISIGKYSKAFVIKRSE